jgi:pyruvate/2-oxoglutarate dehydrogenase complex dihydrolipoamide acyltransferase (E2) component
MIATSHIYHVPAEVGDFVERDEEIATIETDKVSLVPQSPG